MKSKPKNRLTTTQRQLIEQCCGEIHEDDCIDPRTFFKPNRNQKQNYKGQQLCRQAFETLALVIGDCDDELMQLISISQVSLSDDGCRLIATVTRHHQAPSQRSLDLEGLVPEQILARLSLQIPRLRFELARSISRKRVPNLSFEFDYYSNTTPEQNHE